MKLTINNSDGLIEDSILNLIRASVQLGEKYFEKVESNEVKTFTLESKYLRPIGTTGGDSGGDHHCDYYEIRHHFYEWTGRGVLRHTINSQVSGSLNFYEENINASPLR